MTALHRVSVPVAPGNEEVARAAMLAAVPAGFEEAGGPARLELIAYVGDDDLRRVRAAFPHAVVAAVEEGWETAWRTHHRPVVAGGLWIGPPWETPPADAPAVVIDPGRAFGTGAHATTRLCLELLAHMERGSLLDIGCGSGVIALAAVRMGFDPVIAIDNDPVAIEAATVNATVNGLDLRVALLDAETDPLPVTDVAVVNVLLEPVEAVLGRLEARAVATSGYLAGERPAHHGWEHVASAEADGWAADRFRRAPT
jgi:ribosomal protein L11 methyltransferase